MKKRAIVVFAFLAAAFLLCGAVWERHAVRIVVADVSEVIARLDAAKEEIKSVVAVMESWQDPQKEEMRTLFVDMGVYIHDMKENLLLVREMMKKDASFAHDFISSAEMREALTQTLELGDEILEKITQFRHRMRKDTMLII